MEAKGETRRETALSFVGGLGMLEVRGEVKFEATSGARTGVSDRSMDRGESCFLPLVGAVIMAGLGDVALEGTADRFIALPEELVNRGEITLRSPEGALTVVVPGVMAFEGKPELPFKPLLVPSGVTVGSFEIRGVFFARALTVASTGKGCSIP